MGRRTRSGATAWSGRDTHSSHGGERCAGRPTSWPALNIEARFGGRKKFNCKWKPHLTHRLHAEVFLPKKGLNAISNHSLQALRADKGFQAKGSRKHSSSNQPPSESPFPLPTAHALAVSPHVRIVECRLQTPCRHQDEPDDPHGPSRIFPTQLESRQQVTLSPYPRQTEKARARTYLPDRQPG